MNEIVIYNTILHVHSNILVHLVMLTFARVFYHRHLLLYNKSFKNVVIRSNFLAIKITIALAYKSSYAQLRQLKVVFLAFSEDFNS